MPTWVVVCFVLAAVAPVVHSRFGTRAGWVLAGFPAAICAWLIAQIPDVASGQAAVARIPWVPGLGLDLAFRLDGLSLLFALMIAGVGALVLVYSGAYLAGDPRAGRFQGFLLGFLGSMLGLVWADNLLLLFVFWELTSITSFFLIGHHHERPQARAAALQALMVTGGGGLALLAGLLLLGSAAGSWSITELAGRGEALAAHPQFRLAFFLLLGGAFTKSAQVPFHFWLPNAMEAPTPASAYLHAATMVKAGVYLLARLSPALAATPEWRWALPVVGGTTFVLGAALALGAVEYKRILAYTTVSALGGLVFLLGLGTAAAAQAAMLFFLAHVGYKGALFLVAGIVDHETGEREPERLGGLWRAMPVTGTVALMAGMGMAALPPFLGFVAKERLYEAALALPAGAIPAVLVAAVASALTLVAAAVTGARPFLGTLRSTARPPHEAPPALLLGPAVLALGGLLVCLWPAAVARALVSPAVSAVAGVPLGADLALWHGLTPALGWSLATFAAGAAAWWARESLRRLGSRFAGLERFAPSHGYETGLQGILGFARLQTRLLQNGYLRTYLLVIVLASGAVATWALVRLGLPSWPVDPGPLHLHEAALAGIILVATGFALVARSRLAAIASLGVVGYGIALLFLVYGAPDLALTQIVVESLTVILLAFAFYHLPHFHDRSTRRTRQRDAVVAAGAGGLLFLLVLVCLERRWFEPISEYYARASLPEAHGRNVVNVILVDFRALDTLGEITVLAVAAAGVFALLRSRPGGRESV